MSFQKYVSLVTMWTSVIVIGDSYSVTSWQAFSHQPGRRNIKGEIIKTVTLANSQQCAIACHATINCGAFIVNREDVSSDGQRLQCQMLLAKGEHSITLDDSFDYYEAVPMESIDGYSKAVSTFPQTTTTVVSLTTIKPGICHKGELTLDEVKQRIKNKNEIGGSYRSEKSCQKCSTHGCSSPSSTYWIVLESTPTGTSHEWKWMDGTVLDFAYWDKDQPPKVPELNTEVFYAYANCSTSKWWASPDPNVCRSFCYYKVE